VGEPVNKNNEQLFHAARTGNLELLNEVLGRGVDIHTHNAMGETALHQAAYYGQLPVMDSLLNRNADIRAETGEGHQPIHAAIAGGSQEAIGLLLQRGVDLQVREDIMPLMHWAVLSNRPTSVQALLDAGCPVNSTDDYDNGNTTMHLAASEDQPEVVRILLENGADPTLVNRHGETAEDVGAGEAKMVLVAYREQAVLRQVAGLDEAQDGQRSGRRM
jgi:ankyrin repeat protein